ncbi:TPA: hypothetical protein ACU967_002445 [Burkholderia contaminans]|uniref:Uncharacterized protein n=1 Tax=Burkholderia contaminans TaxID=488447 RepID=A0AAP4QZ59_9BURK|nr:MULTISPECIES: hypothetical protein [Burkholderia]MBD1410554.1 hypothetical protein [Burkholderia contaminans]MBM6427358.1 hypothetical protein [Burkholderia contaminans]MCA7875665.1 hypothetical protein [Burkholderia contaminans]MDN7564365.1 hypothetical protein [Burkholderia contaminans]MDN8024116.1 hypothetical protein [Burkholderia contaminans]
MDKRQLSPAYQSGAMAFAAVCRELGADMPDDWRTAAERIRDAVGKLSGAQREGFEDAVALLVHRSVCDGDVPIVASWDPIPELEDPDYWLTA